MMSEALIVHYSVLFTVQVASSRFSCAPSALFFRPRLVSLNLALFLFSSINSKNFSLPKFLINKISDWPHIALSFEGAQVEDSAKNFLKSSCQYS